MTPCTVHRHDTGTVYPVKNLGWLLRHRHDVDRIVIEQCPGCFSRSEATLTAQLSVGATINFDATYTCTFASIAVCVDFVTKRWPLDIITLKGISDENE